MKRATPKKTRNRPARPQPASSKTTKFVYSFAEIRLAERAVGSWDGVRALLGGNGANLGEMTKLGLPVPPGFVITRL